MCKCNKFVVLVFLVEEGIFEGVGRGRRGRGVGMCFGVICWFWSYFIVLNICFVGSILLDVIFYVFL